MSRFISPYFCFHLVLIVFNLYQNIPVFLPSLKVTANNLLKAPSANWQGSLTSLSKNWSLISYYSQSRKKALEPSTDLPYWWFSIWMTLPITGPHEEWGLGANVTLTQVKSLMLRLSSREISNCLEYFYLFDIQHWFLSLSKFGAVFVIFKCVYKYILHVFIYFYHIFLACDGVNSSF